MTPAIFRKAKQRFNRNNAKPIDDIKPLPSSSPAPLPSIIPPPEKPPTSPKPPKTWREASSLKPQYIPEDIASITSASTPQWRWPNRHCRAWLAAVLVEDLKLPPATAAEIASRDLGIGANLYCRREEYWVGVLGPESGKVVCGMLVGRREMEGAVPGFCHVRARK